MKKLFVLLVTLVFLAVNFHVVQAVNVNTTLDLSRTFPKSKIIYRRAVKDIVFQNGGVVVPDVNPAKNVFDCAIFNGSTTKDLVLQGSKLNITGNIHSNKNVILKADKAVIGPQSCYIESVGDINIQSVGNSVIQAKQIEKAPVLVMPDISNKILNDASNGVQIIDSTNWKNYVSSDGSFNGPGSGVYLNYNSGIFEFTGDKPLLLQGSYYFKGALKISTSFTKVKSDIYLIADKDITIGGQSVDKTNTADNALFIYSKTSNVLINPGATIPFKGIVYAPAGDVRIDGSGVKFKGSIIGQTVTITNDIELTDVPLNFETQIDQYLKSSISNSKFDFKFILPNDVEPIKIPDGFTSEYDKTTKRYTITGTVNTLLTNTGSKYVITPIGFTIKIKYTKKSKHDELVVYAKNDCSLTFTGVYKDGLDNIVNIKAIDYYPAFTVKLKAPDVQ